jgi:hypothetical protein
VNYILLTYTDPIAKNYANKEIEMKNNNINEKS